MKAEFEKKLAELGFLYNSNSDDFYLFHANNDVDRYLNVQFICTEPVDEIKYGSRNGNEIESIGLFISKLISRRANQTS
jgi:hypothetical protein